MVPLLGVVCIISVFSVTAAKEVKDPKYYRLLEVSTSVSDSDLRKAYHKLALKWHPDKQTKKSTTDRAEAEKRFKEISLAYDTLSNPEKRKLYDQVGEEGMKRGQHAGNTGGFHGGGFDPFKIFEQFFGNGFGGGGGFSFNFNMGGHSEGRKGLFAKHPDEVETLQSEDLIKNIIADSASEVDPTSKQSVVILCIQQNGDCKSLESGFVKLARSHKGAVAFYAADCIMHSSVCRAVEPDVQQYPCVVYYGYKQRVPYRHGPEKISTRSVRLWLANLVPDKLTFVKTKKDYEHFLASAQDKASVLYLTDKVTVPPRLKALSIEFQGRINIAVLSKKESPEAFAALFAPVSQQAAPEKLPMLYNVNAKDLVSKTGPEYHEYFESLVAASQRRYFQELTSDLHSSGVCSISDYRFCLLAIFPSAAELESEQKRGNLLSIAKEYSLEETDPLRVAYVLRDTTPQQQPRLWAMLRQLSASWDTISSGAILWRPKWQRFEVFSGELSDAEALRGFVRSAFMRAALDGHSSLSVQHPEF